jgi:haloalkane dehalogenase
LAWFEALALDGVVLIGHDWGGALGPDWAARHSGRVRGVALMETIIRPLTWPTRCPGRNGLQATSVSKSKRLG